MHGSFAGLRGSSGARLRRYHFHSSESRTTLTGTIRQTPHWARVKPVVWRNRLKMSSSVPTTIAAIDMPLNARNFRSANVSMLNTVRRSSSAVNEKSRFAIENVVRAIVRATAAPWWSSAHHAIPTVPTAMARPAMAIQTNRIRSRIGSSAFRGLRPMRSSANFP